MAKWLSPLERKIYGALLASAEPCMLTSDIAAAIGESVTGDLKAILRNLVERDILESSTRTGFRIRRRSGVVTDNAPAH